MPRLGASATAATPGTATSDAAVITTPRADGVDVSSDPHARHRRRPAGRAENAPVTATLDHPVSAAMDDCSAANA